jgi:hypothetical protein
MQVAKHDLANRAAMGKPLGAVTGGKSQSLGRAAVMPCNQSVIRL